MRKTALNDQKGGLLLEVFVSLVILAVGITGILRLFGQALYTNERNLERGRARVYAEDVLFAAFSGVKDGRIPGRDEAKTALPAPKDQKPLEMRLAVVPLVKTDGRPEEPGVGRSRYARLKTAVGIPGGPALLTLETVIPVNGSPAS